MLNRKLTATLLSLLLAGTGTLSIAHAEDLSIWKLPPVPVPKDNPQTKAKIALGHQLVFDNRLAKDDALSCVGCHAPEAGGGGPTPRAFGHGGEPGRQLRAGGETMASGRTDGQG